MKVRIPTLLMALFLSAFLATVAHAAYPAGHPCLKHQFVDRIWGAYSTDPIRCPPSSATHYFRWALRSDTMIQAPGGGGNSVGSSSPGAGIGTAAGAR